MDARNRKVDADFAKRVKGVIDLEVEVHLRFLLVDVTQETCRGMDGMSQQRQWPQSAKQERLEPIGAGGRSGGSTRATKTQSKRGAVWGKRIEESGSDFACRDICGVTVRHEQHV